MESFKFLKKQQAKTYTIFTVISILLTIFMLSNLETFVNKEVAYLFVVILSSISMWISIKKASREFEKIIIDDEEIRFFFINKMKAPLILPKNKIKIDIYDSKIEFYNLIKDNLIGRVYKNRIIGIQKWNNLIKELSHLNV